MLLTWWSPIHMQAPRPFGSCSCLRSYHEPELLDNSDQAHVPIPRVLVRMTICLAAFQEIAAGSTLLQPCCGPHSYSLISWPTRPPREYGRPRNGLLTIKNTHCYKTDHPETIAWQSALRQQPAWAPKQSVSGQGLDVAKNMLCGL